MTIFTVCFNFDGTWHVDKYLSATKTPSNFIEGFKNQVGADKVYVLEKEELIDIFNIPSDVNHNIIEPVKKERKPRTKKTDKK